MRHVLVDPQEPHLETDQVPETDKVFFFMTPCSGQVVAAETAAAEGKEQSDDRLWDALDFGPDVAVTRDLPECWSQTNTGLSTR